MCDNVRPLTATTTGTGGGSGGGGSGDDVFVSDDAAIEGIGDAPPLFDDGTIASIMNTAASGQSTGGNSMMTPQLDASGSGTTSTQPQQQPTTTATTTTATTTTAVPQARLRPEVVVKMLLLLPGNTFSFYEERQWKPIEAATARLIVGAVSAGAPEVRYGSHGRTRVLDLAHLIQREVGSTVGQVVRVVRADGVEMMRGNPTGAILVNPQAEAALQQQQQQPQSQTGSGGAGGGGPPVPGPFALTQTQKELLANPGNTWFYAEGGQWKPIPPVYARSFGSAVTAGAPGVAFDWGQWRFALDFRTFVMTNTKNGVGHLVLCAAPSRAEILRGHVNGALWKMGVPPPTQQPLQHQQSSATMPQPMAPVRRSSLSSGGGSDGGGHLTRSYSGRIVDVGSGGVVSGGDGSGGGSSVDASSLASANAYLASVGLNLKKLLVTGPSLVPSKSKPTQRNATVPVWDGMLLVGATQHGPAPARGCESTVLSTVIRDTGVGVVRIWDQDTGVVVTDHVKLENMLYYPHQIGGASTAHVGCLLASLIVTDGALSTHYARRAVVEVCNTSSVTTSSSGTVGSGAGGTTITTQESSLAMEPSQLLMLTKLVAASENECARTSSGGSKVCSVAALLLWWWCCCM